MVTMNIKKILVKYLSYEFLENIRNTIYSVVYYLGIGWVLSRFRARGASILLYHSVAGNDVFWNNVVDLDRFHQQVRYLAKRRKLVPLQQIIEKLYSGDPIPYNWVAITFDDGYTDFYENALPILEKYSAPATLFVPTGVLDNKYELFIDTLNRIIINASISELSLTFSNVNLNLPLGTVAQKRDAVLKIALNIREWDSDMRDRFIPELAGMCGVEDYSARQKIYATPDDLQQSSELVEIGSHTVSHCNLGAISTASAKTEVEDSKEVLEKAWRKPVVSFAYPYGKPWSFNEDIKKLLKESGYNCACTTAYGQVFSVSDPFALPRIAVGSSLTRLKLNLLGLSI